MIWCIAHGAEAVISHTDRRRNPGIRNSPCDLVEVIPVEDPGPYREPAADPCPTCGRPSDG